MKNIVKKISILSVLTLFPLVLSSIAAETSPENWQREASERIEKHRKSDVAVTVRRDGKPVAGATVEIEMLQHEFLFGGNAFQFEIDPGSK